MPPKGRPRRAAVRKKVPPPVKPTDETMAEREPPLTEASPGDDVVLASELIGEKTLLEPQAEQPETTVDDVILASELLREKTLLEPQAEQPETAVDDAVLASEPANEKDKVVTDNSNDSVGKVKKVVKKTVKVVKKVIKRVPKKVAKSEIVSKQLKLENHNSISNLEELKAENNDSILNLNSTNSAGIFEEEESKSGSTSVQLKAENDDYDVLVCNKVEVEENKGDLEENQGENVTIRGSELMEIDDVPNNEGDIKEKGGECRKEGEDLGISEGGKEEKREGEEVADGRGEEAVGEGKLFRGELEAMERRKRRKTEIHIGRLDKDIQEDDIRKVFAEVGEIVDLRVILNSKTGKKFAFLRYASAEEAKRALDKFAKVEICGKECGATPVEGNDTIFLGNIDKKWKDEDVVRLLNKIGIGKIDKVTVMIDPNNRECNRGFAFVEFLTINDAKLAYTKLQEKDVFGKNQKLKVAWAEPLKELDEEEMLKVKTVYAEFIPSSWNETKLRDAFKKFGEIDDIVLARNLQTSKRKDFAFISFKTRVAAIKCIESFGHELSDKDGPKVNVKVSLAKPKAKGKQRPIAKPFAKDVPHAMPKASHSKVRPSEPLNRTQPTVPRYGIQIPEMSSTNVELVQLLREQASWRSPHASLSNSPMDIRYSNPLSGRKRQISVLETDPLHGESNRYPHSWLDAPYSVASSSHNLMPPSGLKNPVAYHQQHSGYLSGSLYGARNYASNVEIRDKAQESSFPYRRYWQLED